MGLPDNEAGFLEGLAHRGERKPPGARAAAPATHAISETTDRLGGEIVERGHPAVMRVETAAGEYKLSRHEGVRRMALTQKDARVMIITPHNDQGRGVARTLGFGELA